MTETTLEELEIRIAYQDDTISQLSDLLYRQDQALTRLAERCKALETRVAQLKQDSGDTYTSADERPPHY